MAESKIVIKRDGKTEQFKKSKIERACVKSGTPLPIARTVAGMVSEKVRGKIKSSKIREMTLGLLEKAGKSAKNWREYDKKKKKR